MSNSTWLHATITCYMLPGHVTGFKAFIDNIHWVPNGAPFEVEKLVQLKSFVSFTATLNG